MSGTSAGTRDLAAEFDSHRRYLAAVAYRMLGSLADVEDAVQEAWFRLDRTSEPIDDLRAWLTRVVSRICLDQLRARSRRPEDPLEGLPDLQADDDPAARAETADRVSYALMIVLDQLGPDERLAYVLHDVFGLPFDEVAGIVDRTPVAVRKLASRARERIRGGDPDAPRSDATIQQRRAVVEAFLEAAGSGDFARLLEVLHPDVEFRIDTGSAGIQIVRGAEQVASGATAYRSTATDLEFEILALGDGFGVLSSRGGVPASLLLVTSEGGRITAMETRLLP